MTHKINIANQFGSRLSNGEQAYAFRVSDIERYLNICEKVTLDFTGVRASNSSFINALIAGLFEDHGEELLQKISFKGCLPTIVVLLQSAISLGMSRHSTTS